ncbi:MAG TPA: HAD family phosphatase [Phycisphaerae bacterium]|jgi:HAD superfamily hydrolase (TIGR01509 family)|nr:HAD family phosphatase [Phycisphaerae bacterium]
MSKGCVIFDFDGVIADTERLHFQAYNQTLALHADAIGGPLHISEQDYFRQYIVYGDREGFFHILRNHARSTEAALIEKLSAAKHDLFEKHLHAFADPLPGVRELLAWLEQRNVPRAICSGARRAEIELLLEAFRLRHHFDVLVTIEDVRRGKPEPEGYNLAFDKLNLEYDAELDRNFSLVIEDSAGGCAAGRAAGIRVLGVATSLSLKDLQHCATHAVESLAKVDYQQLSTWLGLKQ